MERVAFLIEETNQRLGCLLNPESLSVRRTAGVQPRRSATGTLTGARLADDPLIYTGGGRTTLELNVLFDISLAGSSIAAGDVRELTGPLWNLAENAAHPGGYGRPPLVRFIWGKSWNMPGVIVNVAERLEHFTQAGVPQRSWLRLRMFRMSEPALDTAPPPAPAPFAGEAASIPDETSPVHETIGGADEPSGPPSEQQGSGLAGVGDFLGASLSGTAAGNILSSVRQSLSSTTGEILSLFSPEEPRESGEPAVETSDEGLSSASEKIRGAMSSMMSAASSMVPHDGTNIIAAMTTSSAAIASASEAAGAALQTITSKAKSAPGARISTLLTTIFGDAQRSAATVGVVASAVRSRSARIISATVRNIEAAASRLESGLNTIPPVASGAGSGAARVVESALDGLRAALTRMRQEGKAVPAHLVPAAFENIGSALDGLWSRGGHAAGRIISSAVEAASLAVRDASIAMEAIASVSLANAGQIITAEIEKLQSVHDGEPAEVEQARHETLAAARTALRAVESIAQAEELDSAPEALETIRISLSNLEAAEAKDLADTLPSTLKQINDALEKLEAIEEAATEEMIRKVLVVPVDAAAASEEKAGARVGLGERLDQIAFQHYRDPVHWRLLALHNNIDDPLHLSSGRLLRVPSASRRTL
ncbi:MAG: hypothetical protein WD645_01480 [Dehalococcoidia bacterium]